MPRTATEPELGLETVVDSTFYRNCVVRAKTEPEKWSGAITFNNSLQRDSSVMADIRLWEELHKDRLTAYEQGKRCAYSATKSISAIDEFTMHWTSFSHLLEGKRNTSGYDGFFHNGSLRTELKDIYIADLKDMFRRGAEFEMKREKHSRWYLNAARVLIAPVITVIIAAAVITPYINHEKAQMKKEQVEAEERIRNMARSYIEDAKKELFNTFDEYLEKNRDKIVDYDTFKAKIKEAVRESFSDTEMINALKQAMFGFGK